MKPLWKQKRYKGVKFVRQTAWLKTHPTPILTVRPPIPKIRKLMLCRNEFHQGHAIWEKRDGIWSCVAAGTGLEWMVGLERITAKIELAKRDFTWEWT